MNLGNQHLAEPSLFTPPSGSPAHVQWLMDEHRWSYDEAVLYGMYRMEGYSHERALWMLDR